ncbi:DUF5659 domain-containing protein [Peribacillus simplex]|uniref:DUF5659 domain-containing protein n=1 Tax=Peribacillus simplex TaxID=1478 RepID=UPI0016263325|nr:DUF5659 domain-containing protein [Peribacillus simplex]
MSKKRIFNIKMANFLISNGAELLEARQGEVKDKPERVTFLFKNDERLSKALLNFKKI